MLNAESTEILLHPERWRFISSFLSQAVMETPVELVPDVAAKVNSRHTHREIMVPLAGDYQYSFLGAYYPCKPGNIFLIDAGDEHELMYTRNSVGLLHLWLSISPENILGRFLEVNRGNIDFTKRIRIDLNDFPLGIDVNTTWNMVKQASIPADNGLLHAKFQLALTCLFMKAYEEARQPMAEGESYQAEAIATAKKYIAANLCHGISAGRVARLVGYSQFHFSRLFKKYAGVTVVEYVNICRNNELARLRQQNLSGKEIAEHLGFAGPHAFYNWLSKKKSNGLKDD